MMRADGWDYGNIEVDRIIENIELCADIAYIENIEFLQVNNSRLRQDIVPIAKLTNQKHRIHRKHRQNTEFIENIAITSNS